MHLRRILVGISEGTGDAAVQYAARLAARAHAGLTLVDVVENLPRFVRPLLPRGWNVREAVRAHKQSNLERAAARARRIGIDPSVVLLTGQPVRALVREVVRGRNDLVVVDASPSGGIEPLRATAVRLVRECPCPVLLARPTRRRRRPRVLLAVDAGPWRMKATDDVNPALFEVAVRFSEYLGGELHVLHVWAPYAERFMLRAGFTDAEMRQFVTDARAQARRVLENVVAPWGDFIDPTHIYLERGDPRHAIATFAAARRFDLLVIGTVGRAGLAARLIGNTAEAVLARLPCSMLVVKHDPKPGGRTR